MIILGTNSIKDTGYDVANSLRFNDGSSDTLTKSFSSSGNRRTWTFSVWFKLGLVPAASRLFSIGNDASGAIFSIFFTAGDLRIEDVQGDPVTLEFRTDQIFRDPSAWSNLVFACDTTQGTNTNRFKIYHNGTQITSFSTETYPSENADTLVNYTTGSATIGARAASPSNTYFDGYMSEVVMIDGQQLAPTSFGEFDSDSNIWKPIDVSGLTFGTNGFYLDFENSGALGNDAAGSNNFTVNNLTAIDQSLDTCTNNSCVINPLSIASNGQGAATLSNGNLTITSTGSTQNSGTFAPSIDSNSKWYYEFKCGTGATNIDSGVGWGTDVSAFRSGTFADLNSLFLYTADGRIYGTSGWTSAGTAATYTNGDIIGCTVDLENNQIKWYKNNSLAFTISSISFVGDVITPYSQFAQSGAIGSFNFGSPPFAISSGNTDGNGYGNFEYAVPSGFYSINTKNLAEYG